MRALTVMTMMLVALAEVHGQAGDKGKTIKRFGIDLDTKAYPQATPKDALASVLKAIGDNRFDYLMAYLADPEFVDKRVAMLAGQLDPSLKGESKINVAFDRLVKKTTENFVEDPSKLRELKRFLAEGEFEEQDKMAIVSLKNLKARRVFLKRVGEDRWVLMDREK